MVGIIRRLPQRYGLTFHHQASAGRDLRQVQLKFSRYQMHSEKALMDQAADKLIKKAADCFDIAETQLHVADMQHKIASKQHCSADELETSAHKLEALGHALEADAAQIKGDTEVVARGIRIPPSRTAPVPAPASRPRPAV
jgi:hypothetical protein